MVDFHIRSVELWFKNKSGKVYSNEEYAFSSSYLAKFSSSNAFDVYCKYKSVSSFLPYKGISKSFWNELITKYTFTTIKTH
jgi:hypothetical protein